MNQSDEWYSRGVCSLSLSVFFKPRALLRVNARKRLLRLSDSVSGRVRGPSAFTCARACTFYNSVFIIGDLDDDDLQKTTKIEKKISNKKTQERQEEKKRRKKKRRHIKQSFFVSSSSFDAFVFLKRFGLFALYKCCCYGVSFF